MPHSLFILFMLSHTSAAVQGFQQRKGNLQKEIPILDLEVDNLKQPRKKTEHHIPVKSLPEEDRFTRLRMIAYCAESRMAKPTGVSLDSGSLPKDGVISFNVDGKGVSNAGRRSPITRRTHRMYAVEPGHLVRFSVSRS